MSNSSCVIADRERGLKRAIAVAANALATGATYDECDLSECADEHAMKGILACKDISSSTLCTNALLCDTPMLHKN